MMPRACSQLCHCFAPLVCWMKSTGSDFVDLFIRLYMAHVFFGSGWMKLQDYLNNGWSGADAITLGITAIVLLCPIFLVLGVLTRLGALGLLLITLTSIGTGAYASITVHHMWMLLLGTILMRGAGSIALPNLLCGTCSTSSCSTGMCEMPTPPKAATTKKSGASKKKRR